MSNKIDQFKELGGIDEYWFNNFYNESKAVLEQKYLKNFFYNLMKKLYGQPPFPQIIINDYNDHLKRLIDKSYNIIECYKILTDRLNLGDFETIWTNALNEVDEKIKLFEEQNPKSKPKVQLPCNNRTISDFCEDLGEIFKDKTVLFYRPKTAEIVEIISYFDKMKNQELDIIRKIPPIRLISILENNILMFHSPKNDKEIRNDEIFNIENIKSPTKVLCESVLSNDNFIVSLKSINRFMDFPLPFNIDGKFIIPKKGYDERFECYFTTRTPKINLMDIDKAKQLLEKLLSGFCFHEKIDKVMAYAHLITPCCRGLYSDITTRTPLFLIKANRERAGKDYLAGVNGFIYEGKHVEESTIVNGEKGQQSNEELRKKITACAMFGRRRFHSSNNKGFLNNSEFERILTAKTLSDRILSQNKMTEDDNEMEFSMSANWGLTYTGDLWNRCRPINLFFGEEDPNKRTFPIPDLHGYVLKQRANILSAIISLIKDWFDNGMIKSKTPFTSYPEWAEIVGGIMEHHNLGDPCVKLEDDAVGGDTSTENMKSFFEFMYKHSISKVIKSYTLYDMIDIIEMNEDENLFNYLDFKEKKDKIHFSLQMTKFTNRILSGIKLECIDSYSKKTSWKYLFKKYENFESKENKIKTEQKEQSVILTQKKYLSKQIIQADEEFIDDNNSNELSSFEKKELINFKCSICGKSPCIEWSKKGDKPLCKECIKGK